MDKKKLYHELLKSDGIDPAGVNESEQAAFDKILDETLTMNRSEPSNRFSKWRLIMKNPITKSLAAAILVAAAFISITLSDKFVEPAYAIEQTLEAMKDMSTLHLFGKDWDGRGFEMWIKLHPETGIPEYVYSDHYDSGALAISRPDKSYQYSGNRVLVNSGKLYHIDIAPAKVFEMALQASEQISKLENPDASINFVHEYDSKLNKTLLAVSYDSSDESRKIYIDPDTKLPVRILGIKGMKLGAIFKDIDFMEFNVALPEGIFDFEIPEGTTVVDMDHQMQLVADAQNGLLIDGLSEQQAAVQIATEFWTAIIADDKDTMNRLAPTGVMGGAQSTAEIEEIGKLYIQPGCGIGKVLPCTLRFSDGSLKMVKLIIKFREIDNQRSCVIAGTWSIATAVPEKPFNFIRKNATDIDKQSDADTSSYDLSETAMAMQQVENVYGSLIDYKGRFVHSWGLVDPTTGGFAKTRLEYEDGGLYIMADGKTYFEDNGMVAIKNEPYIEVGLLFENFAALAAQTVQNRGKMTVQEVFSEAFQREVVQVDIECRWIYLKAIIDMDIKLPIEFSIAMSSNPTELLKYTVIEYNVDLPDGFFEFDDGPDTMVIGKHLDTQLANDPNFGITYDEQEDIQQVCRQIVSRYLQARIDGDIEAVRQLHPIYISRYGSNKMIEQKEVVAAHTHGKIIEILDIQQAYEQKTQKRMMVPCKIVKEIQGQRQEVLVGVPVYFRQHGGQKSVVVIGYYPKLQIDNK